MVEDSASRDSTPFVIDASGNVGIGTAAPDTNLDVSSGGATFIYVDAIGTNAALLAAARTQAGQARRW
jgi:hypothetical protein